MGAPSMFSTVTPTARSSCSTADAAPAESPAVVLVDVVDDDDDEVDVAAGRNLEPAVIVRLTSTLICDQQNNTTRNKQNRTGEQESKRRTAYRLNGELFQVENRAEPIV